MHNLHLVVVRAESGEHACDTVDSFLLSFGNENNWRAVCGSVSQSNEVHIHESGRYPPDEETNTIEKLNELAQAWVDSSCLGTTMAIRKLKEEPDFSKWNDVYALGSLAMYATDLKEKARVSGKFNILEDSYYAYQYDECGVTQCEENDDTELEKYVVFVDMHS